jgi:DUF1680 family protein
MHQNHPAAPTAFYVLILAALLSASNALAWEAPTPATPESARLAGPWATAQARNAHRLALAPLDQVDFIVDDVALKQHRKFAEYSGDISGRWVGAAAFLAPQFPNDFTLLPQVLAEFPKYQKPDGHFGADQQLPQLNRAHDMPILWGNGRLLIGLVELYDQTGNSNALAMARKMGDYYLATDSVYDQPANLTAVGGSYADGFVTCYFSGIEGLVGLGRITKDPRYVQEAERIAALALSVTRFDKLHSHGRLCAMRGFADLYALTGETRWRDAAERDWQIFATRHLLPTGGVKEMLENACVRDEGCAEADWLRLNLSLWRLTGKARYLDAAERSLNNHFLYQQFANGGAGHRVLHQIAGQPVAFAKLSEEAWWCCGEHWARAMVDVARSAVMSNSRGLFINLVLDCDTYVPGPGGTWKTALRETTDGLDISLTPPAEVKAEVRIHRPAWVTEVSVSKSKVQALEAPKELKVHTEKEAWVVRGTWRKPQHLVVHLPMSLRVEDTGAGTGILLRGHEVLVAYPTSANAWLTSKLPAARPTVLWSAAMPVIEGLTVVPASLAPNPDPSRSEQWLPLELAPMRAQAAVADHQTAWFSFQPRAAKP